MKGSQTTGLRVLQVPILKATLTLPGEKAHFRRTLNLRAAMPTGGTSQWLKISVQDWGHSSVAECLPCMHEGPG